MFGLIYSQRQLEIYRFLERAGPCPQPALEVLFGDKTHRALQKLRKAGYVYNTASGPVEFWIIQNYSHFNPQQQEVLAWFAARLEEQNGQYLGNKSCLTPNGTRLTLEAKRNNIYAVDDNNRKWVANLDELKAKILSNCLKLYKKTK